MNTCVADEKTIVNIQGIRYVTWGETSSMYPSNSGKPWSVTVTYKGNHNTFNYKTEAEARALFIKIREAMVTERPPLSRPTHIGEEVVLPKLVKDEKDAKD